jgi:16S rRNA (guanine527-N7)-methyltransferase
VTSLAEDLSGVLDILGLPLSADQQSQLLAYSALLIRWSRVYNLTAVREPEAVLRLHLADSLSALGPLRRQTQGRAARVLDVGSGGGLPGVVFAIAEPEWAVTCVDAVAKKVSFIRQVSAELGLRHLQAVHARVEDFAPAAAFDVVTSRAFASLADFVSLTRHLVNPDGCWMAMKGKVPEEELAALPLGVEVFHVEQLKVPGLDAQRCLVWMRKKSP